MTSHRLRILCPLLAALACVALSPKLRAADVAVDALWEQWEAQLNVMLLDHYADGDQVPARVPLPAPVVAGWRSAQARELLSNVAPAVDAPFPAVIGALRGRAQQALTLELAQAVREGRVEDARLWRALLHRPRGVSGKEGALLLQTLTAKDKQRADAARLLVREAITWQTTRVRQLLDESLRSARRGTPMPGRLSERLAEALALADLPAALREQAGLQDVAIAATPDAQRASRHGEFMALAALPWATIPERLDTLNRQLESDLPSLLSEQERARRERLLLKLVILIPREYSAGVRNGQVTVPLEYREAVMFTAQARQMVGELAPLWLSDARDGSARTALDGLEAALGQSEATIASKGDPVELEAAMRQARGILEGPFNISVRRAGRTADVVDEVMLEVRSLLGQSLTAAMRGNWDEAERFRLEAYTTYDPELEARLMPRDPKLALDTERLFLDGMGKDQPGVKVLLDRRADHAELSAAYDDLLEYLSRGAALLKSGIDPTAAAINAGSIVLREGLEGLLVIVAILAGLRGADNRHRRRLLWLGLFASAIATLVTYLLSRTLIVSLQRYSEYIEAITCLLAIGVLLLITNWLFHQIYWNRWVSTLKYQAESHESWKLVSVGFLIGYREGFETVLFLQSLVLDAGGGPVGVGVFVGVMILLTLGFCALVLGLRLPYFKLLMITAASVGVVLLSFMGTGVRLMQTVGWLKVHPVFDVSWPAWMGQWFGLYNSYETFGAQIGAALLVLGTWRFSRWSAHRQARQRDRVLAAAQPMPAS